VNIERSENCASLREVYHKEPQKASQISCPHPVNNLENIANIGFLRVLGV
jgi:hypothetical protein